MGLMDKVKAQADKVSEKAQHGAAKGKDKIEEIQAKRTWDQLLEKLGAAVYAAERHGGSRDEITRILGLLDAHAAEHPTIDVTD